MSRSAAIAILGFVAWGAAACTARGADEIGAADGDGDDSHGDRADGGPGAPTFECAVAEDCQLYASTCCACPTYAAPVADGLDSCDAVECPDPPTCSAVTAACDDGRCALRCPARVTTLRCPAGFQRDAAGCLIDACQPGSSDADRAACAADDDCAQVAADCCGCAQGGSDTAVPEDRVDAHAGDLACTGDEACPGIDVCVVDATPRCIAEACALLAEGPLALCGTPDLPPCPGGSSCVLNAEEAHDAAALGVGTCQPD